MQTAPYLINNEKVMVIMKVFVLKHHCTLAEGERGKFPHKTSKK